MQSGKSRLMNLVPLVVIGVTAVALIGIFGAGARRGTGQTGEVNLEGTEESSGEAATLTSEEAGGTGTAIFWASETYAASMNATPTPSPTSTDPFGGMNATPTAVFDFLPPGALVTLEDVGDIPAGTLVVVGSTWWSEETGRIYSISTLDYSVSAEAREDQLGYAPDYDPGQPTPFALYSDPMYSSPCGLLTVTEDIPLAQPVGDITFIAAGTVVSAYPSQMSYVEGVGAVWLYQVTPIELINNPPDDQFGYYSGMATEDQLAPVPDATPGPSYENLAGADFSREIGMGPRFVTTEDVGDIPEGTLVSISTGQPGCDAWIFQIVTEDYSLIEWASPDQLEYAPGVTPGATPDQPWPSPTWAPTPTPVPTRTPKP
jgi:hypothetical protein